jgi:hypothetical protein
MTSPWPLQPAPTCSLPPDGAVDLFAREGSSSRSSREEFPRYCLIATGHPIAGNPAPIEDLARISVGILQPA